MGTPGVSGLQALLVMMYMPSRKKDRAAVAAEAGAQRDKSTKVKRGLFTPCRLARHFGGGAIECEMPDGRRETVPVRGIKASPSLRSGWHRRGVVGEDVAGVGG